MRSNCFKFFESVGKAVLGVRVGVASFGNIRALRLCPWKLNHFSPFHLS